MRVLTLIFQLRIGRTFLDDSHFLASMTFCMMRKKGTFRSKILSISQRADQDSSTAPDCISYHRRADFVSLLDAANRIIPSVTPCTYATFSTRFVHAFTLSSSALANSGICDAIQANMFPGGALSAILGDGESFEERVDRVDRVFTVCHWYVGGLLNCHTRHSGCSLFH